MNDLPPARRSLGQNFLIRAGAIQRIVESLDDDAGPPRVVEIGPGRGALTEPLIQAAGTIVAVEADKMLAATLRERFGASLRLEEGDILRQRFSDLFGRLEPTPGLRHVVGNLPYNISKPIAMMLVDQCDAVDRAVVMFQQEVADRFLAGPGDSAYGPLTILTGCLYRVRRLIELPPSAFRPRPRVHSTVVAWNRLGSSPFDDPTRRQRLKDCLRACFAQRRKTLRNNLRSSGRGVEQLDTLLKELDLSGDERAESLAPEIFYAMAERWTQP
ncbi:MAG: 16S rRNA (adenine(1518)-N(6)/adenine(1519)-N(6))-dimethyltransferase RsmA [Acidobacteriota bacterium]|nr:16S rRNA (adenine(1518)-N(6)/adenine(1519)-N(6))-dimethyltransferase RsmA [Acidobacteriota bacterium]